MCGIAGVLHCDGMPVSAVRLKAMTDAIAHRGPDGEGQFIDGPAGLGHRRLAIIDLSPLGRQPMTTSDGRYTLIFNGEIYNFQELRSELTLRGHAFVSRTDSEVVLHAFSEWGLGCLRRLNGMFAFAIWDEAERVLFLAHYDRDRTNGNPRIGWTDVIVIYDLATVAPDPLEAKAMALRTAWRENWEHLEGSDEHPVNRIETAVDDLRTAAIGALRSLR